MHKSLRGQGPRSTKGKFSTSHGMSFSTTYSSWASMKSRCLNSRDEHYPQYGGAGITVCQRWSESFQSFLEDMGSRPINMTLDRINNNKGYSPDNCRWATPKEQMRNRRNTLLLTLNGKTMPATAWAELLDIPYSTILHRLQRGDSVERALATKTHIRRGLNYGGKTQSFYGWESELGLPKGIICKRLRRGWNIEKTLTTPAIGGDSAH